MTFEEATQITEIRKRLLELKAYQLMLEEHQQELFAEIIKTQSRRLKLETKAIGFGVEFY